MSDWPTKERRQEYVEMLLNLNSDVTHIKEKVNEMAIKMDHIYSKCPACNESTRWMTWAINGIIAWLAGLTWWIIKKLA